MPHLELPTVANGSGRVLLFSFEELAIQLRELVLDLVDAPLNYGNPAGGRVVVVNCAVRGEALVGWNGRRGAQRPGDRSSKIRRLKSGFLQKFLEEEKWGQLVFAVGADVAQEFFVHLGRL